MCSVQEFKDVKKFLRQSSGKKIVSKKTLVTRNKVSREHRFSKLEDCTYGHPFEFAPPPGVHPKVLPGLNILGEAV